MWRLTHHTMSPERTTGHLQDPVVLAARELPRDVLAVFTHRLAPTGCVLLTSAVRARVAQEHLSVRPPPPDVGRLGGSVDYATGYTATASLRRLDDGQNDSAALLHRRRQAEDIVYAAHTGRQPWDARQHRYVPAALKGAVAVTAEAWAEDALAYRHGLQLQEVCTGTAPPRHRLLIEDGIRRVRTEITVSKERVAMGVSDRLQELREKERRRDEAARRATALHQQRDKGDRSARSSQSSGRRAVRRYLGATGATSREVRRVHPTRSRSPPPELIAIFAALSSRVITISGGRAPRRCRQAGQGSLPARAWRRALRWRARRRARRRAGQWRFASLRISWQGRGQRPQPSLRTGSCGEALGDRYRDACSCCDA